MQTPHAISMNIKGAQRNEEEEEEKQSLFWLSTEITRPTSIFLCLL